MSVISITLLGYTSPRTCGPWGPSVLDRSLERHGPDFEQATCWWTFKSSVGSRDGYHALRLQITPHLRSVGTFGAREKT